MPMIYTLMNRSSKSSYAWTMRICLCICIYNMYIYIEKVDQHLALFYEQIIVTIKKILINETFPYMKSIPISRVYVPHDLSRFMQVVAVVP